MSWCTVEDIGEAATIRHVKIAQQVWESFVGPYALYAPSASWAIRRVPWLYPDGSQWAIGLGARCISVSEIQIYRDQQLRETVSTVEVKRNLGIFDTPTGLYAQMAYDMVVTGVRGTATLKGLTVGDDLLAGQSVLRAGDVVLLEADGTALADDELIEPPELLRSAALTVGRRVIQIEQDQQASYDDSTYGGGGIGNRLVDGWIGPVQEFLK